MRILTVRFHKSTGSAERARQVLERKAAKHKPSFLGLGRLP